ncbi:MAG: hypothetical protein LC775_03960 [Acidobacteria bacterium]|nr:hypothetical protein [Acidobacteriota bacterium]
MSRMRPPTAIVSTSDVADNRKWMFHWYSKRTAPPDNRRAHVDPSVFDKGIAACSGECVGADTRPTPAIRLQDAPSFSQRDNE